MIITNQVVKATIEKTNINAFIEEKKPGINISETRIYPIVKEDIIKPVITQEAINVKVVENPVNVSIPIGVPGVKGDKGDAGEPGSGINAIQIQGLPVDTASPKEGELFYFDGAKWTAKDGREESCLNFNTIINGGYF